MGTSPRTRGKQHRRYLHRNQYGNIPAHAGKTIAQKILDDCAEEHPRARGENDRFPVIVNATTGTSPRTRGKLHILQGQAVYARNIPAHAGKT